MYSNYRHRWRRRILSQWHRAALQQITEENLPKPRKDIVKQIQKKKKKKSKHQRETPHHIAKTLSIHDKESILETVKEKIQIPCKRKSMRITASFSVEALKVRKNRAIQFKPYKTRLVSLGYYTQQNFLP